MTETVTYPCSSPKSRRVAVPEMCAVGGEDGLEPWLEGIEAIVLRTVNDQPTFWDSILPVELLVLSGEIARVDGRVGRSCMARSGRIHRVRASDRRHRASRGCAHCERAQNIPRRDNQPVTRFV